MVARWREATIVGARLIGSELDESLNAVHTAFCSSPVQRCTPLRAAGACHVDTELHKKAQAIQMAGACGKVQRRAAEVVRQRYIGAQLNQFT
jgi:hypothetical protein